ncbi:MAG: hypothetical protein M3O25_11380, partial [Actinomycetota bacterium]|nr:hypothetical protein [Actinomycetota bacterium]
VTMGKVWELTLDQRKVRDGRSYDLVVVDAPATGHGVGFLQTPRTFANIARVGPMAQQAEALDAAIHDSPRTGIAVVALPEEMPVNETAALERELAEKVGVEVERIYCNGLYPDRFDAGEVERLRAEAEGGDGGVRAACRAAVSEADRARTQREQLLRLERSCEAPVTTLPFLFSPDLREAEIGELAELVAG